MKREKTAIWIVSLIAMLIVMVSSVSVSALEINNGFVFFDAGEHVDLGLRCPEEVITTYADEVQTRINDYVATLGLALPEEPDLNASNSLFANIAAINDYLRALPIRFYTRSHRVPNEGSTGFSQFTGAAAPELFHTLAVENQSGTRIGLPVELFFTDTVGIEDLEAVTGVVSVERTPYTPPSASPFPAQER